jgi:hypothetical protein
MAATSFSDLAVSREFAVEVVFENAVLKWKSRESLIAPAELLEGDKKPGNQPRPVTFGPDDCSCTGKRGLGRAMEQAVVAKVSGRGYWHEASDTFVIRCFCTVEPVAVDDELLGAFERR